MSRVPASLPATTPYARHVASRRRREQPSKRPTEPAHRVFAVDAAAVEAAVDAVRAVVDDEAALLAASRIGGGAAHLGDGVAAARLFGNEQLGELALQLLRVCGFWNGGIARLPVEERLLLLRAIADAVGVNDVVRAAAKVQLLELGVDGRDAALVRIDGLGPWLELAQRIDDESEARAIVAPRLTDRYDAWRVSRTPLAEAPWIVDEALRVLHVTAVSAVMLLIANDSVRAREEVLAILARERSAELKARWPTDGAQHAIDEELSGRARDDVAAAFDAFLESMGRPPARRRHGPHVIG